MIEGGRRPPHFHAACVRRFFRQIATGFLHGFRIVAGKDDRGQSPIRRCGCAFAPRNFLREERIAVAGGECLHHDVFGISGLQQNQPRLLRTARAACNLMQQLEGAFAGLSAQQMIEGGRRSPHFYAARVGGFLGKLASGFLHRFCIVT